MSRLGQYKKAEKGAKDIVNDYETMKMKYFTVLTENEQQKTQISELIQTQLGQSMEIKKVKKERDTQMGTIYTLRMDAEKKYKQVEQVVIQVKELKQERD